MGFFRRLCRAVVRVVRRVTKPVNKILAKITKPLAKIHPALAIAAQVAISWAAGNFMSALAVSTTAPATIKLIATLKQAASIYRLANAIDAVASVACERKPGASGVLNALNGLGQIIGTNGYGLFGESMTSPGLQRVGNIMSSASRVGMAVHARRPAGVAMALVGLANVAAAEGTSVASLI